MEHNRECVVKTPVIIAPAPLITPDQAGSSGPSQTTIQWPLPAGGSQPAGDEGGGAFVSMVTLGSIRASISGAASTM
ncbi:hypothetical protein JCM12296A_45000 [Desulfosarcina cetonica]